MSNFVEAAGAVVARRSVDGSMEVCLVHRPKYDDWSFPKGKLEEHESLAHTAVREVQEETGIAIRLSRLLTEVTYSLHADGSEGSRDKSRKAGKHNKRRSLTKHVVYWVGEILDPEAARLRQDALGARIERDKEADTVEWLGLTEAEERLTYETDRGVLKKFATSAPPQGRDHAEATVLLIRHGKAESRKRWTGSEALRPLTPVGAGASFALSRELACFDARRLVTSPWLRCAQTLTPFAVSCRSELHEVEELSEDGAQKNPELTKERVHEVLRDAAQDPTTPVAICTHRPVFAVLFPYLATLCATPEVAKAIPAESPYLQTAYGLAFSVILDNDEPTITAIQKVEPVVY
jgi:8-oxo-dGTP diphosphatase